MPNPYLTDEISQLTSSHKQSMAQMQQASKQLGEQGVRAVSLWQGLVAQLSTDEATAAGGIVYERSLAMWEVSKLDVAKGLDALALSLGTTRQALLDEVALVPATFG
jgi:hypothetical protein